MSTPGFRLWATRMMSRMTAPVGDVTTPIFLTRSGNCAFAPLQKDLLGQIALYCAQIADTAHLHHLPACPHSRTDTDHRGCRQKHSQTAQGVESNQLKKRG